MANNINPNPIAPVGAQLPPPSYQQALAIIHDSNLSRLEVTLLLGCCAKSPDLYNGIVHACAASPDVNGTLRSILSMFTIHMLLHLLTSNQRSATSTPPPWYRTWAPSVAIGLSALG